MKASWKTVLLWTLPLVLIGFFVWQAAFASVPPDNVKNSANTRLTYGRFLEYLHDGKVERVDLFHGGTTAIVELADDLTTACRLLAEELPDIIEIVKTNDPRSFKTKNLLISIESQYRRMYGEWPTSSDGGKEGSFPNFLQKLADLSNLANDGAFSPHDVRTLSRAFHDRPRRKT